MIQKILSIYLLVSYGSLITDSSLIGNSNDVLMTSKNSLTSDIESNQRKELLDNVQIQMAKNDCYDINPSEFKRTKKFLEKYKKYLVDLNNVCNICDDKFMSHHTSWEYFEFKMFLENLKKFSLLVQPDENILISLDKCIKLFESVYTDKFVSCEIN
ncbi:hypothetical protein P3W45_000804 [Vairimorpha bombi]